MTTSKYITSILIITVLPFIFSACSGSSAVEQMRFAVRFGESLQTEEEFFQPLPPTSSATRKQRYYGRTDCISSDSVNSISTGLYGDY